MFQWSTSKSYFLNINFVSEFYFFFSVLILMIKVMFCNMEAKSSVFNSFFLNYTDGMDWDPYQPSFEARWHSRSCRNCSSTSSKFVRSYTMYVQPLLLSAVCFFKTNILIENWTIKCSWKCMFMNVLRRVKNKFMLKNFST